MYSASEDLRSIKTERALYAAMFSLLESQNFKKITVKEICEQSLISRAAFYAHFIDKYDLLKRWISNVWLKNFDFNASLEQVERSINSDKRNLRIIKNLIYEADSETYGILFDYLLSTQELNTRKSNNKDIHQRNIVLSNFYAGGIIAYLTWQIKNKFPPDIPLANRHVHEMIERFKELSEDLEKQ